MSRVDELQAKIEASYRNPQAVAGLTDEPWFRLFARMYQAYEDANPADVRKDVAAAGRQWIADQASLKAESEKPMRFEVWLDDHGSPIWVSNDKGNCGIFSHEYKNKIIAIEIKPIVVTVDMAAKFYRAFNAEMGFVHQHIRMVAGLNAIGIEARAGDE